MVTAKQLREQSFVIATVMYAEELVHPVTHGRFFRDCRDSIITSACMACVRDSEFDIKHYENGNAVNKIKGCLRAHAILLYNSFEEMLYCFTVSAVQECTEGKNKKIHNTM